MGRAIGCSDWPGLYQVLTLEPGNRAASPGSNLDGLTVGVSQRIITVLLPEEGGMLGRPEQQMSTMMFLKHHETELEIK